MANVDSLASRNMLQRAGSFGQIKDTISRGFKNQKGLVYTNPHNGLHECVMHGLRQFKLVIQATGAEANGFASSDAFAFTSTRKAQSSMTCLKGNCLPPVPLMARMNERCKNLKSTIDVQIVKPCLDGKYSRNRTGAKGSALDAKHRKAFSFSFLYLLVPACLASEMSIYCLFHVSWLQLL